MKRTNQQSLGSLIKEFLKNHNLEDKITETKIITIWEKIMGPGISKYTQKITLTGNCVTIYISSSVLHNELSIGKTRIIQMLNKELNKEVVKELIFRQA